MTHGTSNQLTRSSKGAVMVWHQPVDVDLVWCQPAGQGSPGRCLGSMSFSDWVPSRGPTHCRDRLNLLRAFWGQRRRINGRPGGQKSLLATAPDSAEGKMSIRHPTLVTLRHFISRSNRCAQEGTRHLVWIVVWHPTPYAATSVVHSVSLVSPLNRDHCLPSRPW